jgi:RND family efflux transporter MFP subunit
MVSGGLLLAARRTVLHEDAHKPVGEPAKPPSRPLRGFRWIGLLAVPVAIGVVAGGILERRSHEREVTKWTDEQAIPTVAVITPKIGSAIHSLTLPATVQAWYEAPIYSRVTGYLKNWYFDYGAHVKKGDILAEIDAPDLDAQLVAAQARSNSARAVVKVREAEKKFAESTYKRWRDSPPGVVSVQEQESKQADFNSALARLNAAYADVGQDQGEVDRLEALENFKKIVAPFGGVVTARETDIGALINAGSGTGGGNGPELFRVDDIHKMRIYAQVPQQMSAGIQPGLTTDVTLPQYSDKTFKSTIATTSSAINMTARTLLVELHADNPDGMLQPGAYAQVKFNLSADPSAVVRIPTSALMFREDGLQVAVLGPGDKVELQRVTLGPILGTEVEVVKGLSASDRVINSPPDSLAAGDVVRVGEPSPPPEESAANASQVE